VESGLLALLAVAVIKGLTMLAGYLANSNTFPQPLSEAGEAKYLARLQKGEEEARSVLIESNLRLLAHIVKALWAKLQEPNCMEKRGLTTLG